MKQQKQSVLKSNKEFWYNPVTVVLGALLLFFTAQLIGSIWILPFTGFVTSQNYQMFLFVSTNVIVLVLLLQTALKTLGFTWKQIGWRASTLQQYLLVVPSFLVYLVATVTFTMIATRFIPGFDVTETQDVGFSTSLNSLELVAAFITLVILTPVFEELIFRGVLFKGLRKKAPFWVAAAISSLAFAIAHMQWNVAVDTFALGLALCYLVEKTKSIGPAILLHAVKNAIAFTLLFVLNVG